MNKAALAPSFWITNISNQDVALGDLGLTIRSFTSINLLDSGHYPYLNLKMIKASEKSGSLFKKSKKVVHRKIPPDIEKKTISIDTISTIPTRQHSIIEFKEETYEELNIPDDDIISTISNVPVSEPINPKENK